MPDLKYMYCVAQKWDEGTYGVGLLGNSTLSVEEKRQRAQIWEAEAHDQGKDTKYVVVRRLVSEWEEV